MPFWFTFTYQAVLSFVATLGFTMLYNAPHKALLICALIGMGGHLLRITLQQAGLSPDFATFLGALFVGMVGTVPARRLKLPLILFAITGIVPMIPGIPAYKAVVYFSQRNVLEGLQSAVQAGFSVAAIATGIGTARILTDSDWWLEKD